MKKIFYLLICGLLFISCQQTDYNEDYVKNVVSNYNTAFIKTFGTPATNQNWGFSNRLTRSAYPNSNMWTSEGYVIPAAITQAEISKVFNAFNEVGEESYEALVNWDCFFVQHVYGAHSNMDWLYAWDPVGTTTTIYPDWNQWQATEVTQYEDHIYNFNATSGSIQLMVNSSTQCFGFHSSQDSQLHPTFRMMKINGAYYVGFDYYANGQNPNQQEARLYTGKR